MGAKGAWRWATAFVVLLAAVLTWGAPRECVYKNRALVIALLALHRGENCDLALQRGAQQVAALQLARDSVNAENSNFPELEVKVFDTCSSAEQSVKAALNALVKAQQGCQGPFFLGLLGPDDPDSLRAVAKVISVFHYPHVVLSTVKSFAQFGTLNVQIIEPSVSAKGLRMLLEELNWSSFYLAFTPDAISSETATSLLEAEELCVLSAVLQIPSANSPNNDFSAYNRLLHALQRGDASRVLILSDTAESAEALLRHLQGVSSRTKFIVYVRGSGILPWRLSKEMAENTLILQETSKSTIIPETFQTTVESSPLWHEYKNQSQCDGECADGPFVRDVSTTNIAYSIHLFHEALKSGQSLKCRPGNGICSQLAGMPTENWRTHLESTSTVLNVGEDGKDGHRVRFHMVLPSEIHVFAVGDTSDVHEEVGSIKDGEQLNLIQKTGLPIATSEKHEQCGTETLLLAPERTSTTSSPSPATTGMPMDVDIFGIDVKLGDLSFYELVGFLTGLMLLMIIILLIMLCAVYRCFRVKANNTYSSPSSTSGDRPPKQKKKSKLDAKRFFNSSIRSVHTVRE